MVIAFFFNTECLAAVLIKSDCIVHSTNCFVVETSH